MINKLLKPILEALPENNRLERIWVLAKTDFLKRYYGSFLGLVWALINPLSQLVIYYFVFTIVFKNRTENFALFLFLGLLAYMFFAETSTVGLNLLRQKSYILENIQIKWIDIYFAATLSTFFGFLFNLSAYFIISLFMDVQISLYALLVPVLILSLMMFGMAVQMILSVIQIYVRDIVHVWDLCRMALLWLSGIFYPIDPAATWKSAILSYITPLSGIVHNLREVLIYGRPVNTFLMFYDLAYAALLLGIAFLLFNKFKNKALEKI